MVILQQINKSQLVKLLDAINCEGIDNQYWAVNSYSNSWNAEITQQKPILCLESHTRLFRSALDSIMEAYSKGEYSDEDLRREYCPDVIEVYTDWMRYKFRCSIEYEAYMLMVGDVEGNNVCNAIDAAWTWFHTGFVNNFISKDPETNLLHLNW